MKQIFEHNRSIKWKIFGSLLIFIGIVILVLWLFQVFFLESFYMYTKEHSVKEAAAQINRIISENTQECKNKTMDRLDSIVNNNAFCVSVYIDKKPWYTEFGNEGRRCGITSFDIKSDTKLIETLQSEAIMGGGVASRMLEKSVDEWDTMTVVEENDRPVPNDLTASVDKEKHSMTYVSVVHGKDQQMYTVVITALLTPINATIDTIKMQFIIIAGILILIAVILALYLSRKIASPIIEINQGAKTLAKGNYDIQFRGEGYQEIEELNDTLNYAAKELSKVESLRRELLANMSHDLRTPLTMISGYGEVMRDIPGENNAENIQIIIEETRRLTSLVNDMLDLSKLQAGVQELHTEVFDLTQEIQQILHRYDKLLIHEHYDIRFVCDENIIVRADLLKIGQVIYNLINNAINYSDINGQIIIRQRLQGQQVLVEVEDHGLGIEKEQLPYIWERYYKVDKTHVRSKVGSGIGLSIVKTILELHQASYGVRSTLGKGTTFWFALPVVDVQKHDVKK